MRKQRRLMNQINVVPYIDVMLVLLVIFMVTAPMLPTGTVDLPSVEKSSQAKGSPLIVQISKEGTFTLKNRASNTEQTVSNAHDLIKMIQNAQTKNAEQTVVIAADKSIRYEKVMEIMSLLQQNQISKIGLLVESSQSK